MARAIRTNSKSPGVVRAVVVGEPDPRTDRLERNREKDGERDGDRSERRRRLITETLSHPRKRSRFAESLVAKVGFMRDTSLSRADEWDCWPLSHSCARSSKALPRLLGPAKERGRRSKNRKREGKKESNREREREREPPWYSITRNTWLKLFKRLPPWRSRKGFLRVCIRERYRSPTYGYERRSVPRTDSTAADSPALQSGPLPPENSLLLPADFACTYVLRITASDKLGNSSCEISTRFHDGATCNLITQAHEECRINNSLNGTTFKTARQLPCKQLISYSRGIRRIREFHAILRNTKASGSDERNIAIP